MGDHFIERCKNCQTVMSQCRCPGPKAVRWSLCEKCKKSQEPGMQVVGLWEDNERLRRELAQSDALREIRDAQMEGLKQENDRLRDRIKDLEWSWKRKFGV